MAIETLYLVRHGKAVGSHPNGDRFRELSAEGIRRIETMVPAADRQGFRVDLALSSPYVRAVQTRDRFLLVCRPSRSELTTAATPDSDPEDLYDELRMWEAEGIGSVALFTHNPFVTEFAERLLAKEARDGVEFHTPTVLALRFEGGLRWHQGRPLWVLHP